MPEKHFFFPDGNHRLFGVLHYASQHNSSEGFVFCHPFAEEKLWTHRVFVNFARVLSKLGYHVLRFDYMGHGDSSGSFEDSTIETRISNIQCAIATLETEVPDIKNINLLGLRLGGTLAALVASQISKIDKLILWEPIVDGQRYMKDLFRINIATQSAVFKEIKYNTEALVNSLLKGKTVNIDGYEINHSLYSQMLAIDLANLPQLYEGKTLVVQINRKLGMGTKRVQPLEHIFTKATTAEVEEQPFWKEIKDYYAFADSLFDTTKEWLKFL